MNTNNFKKLSKRAKFEIDKLLNNQKQKVFGIGRNKTGTTSLTKAMKELGYKVGIQRNSELMVDDWLIKDFRKLIKYCKTADFFQDIPFSFNYTFIILDQAFSGSKFILTVRDSAEDWYNSTINFHSKIFGNGNVPPTIEDIKNADYIHKGYFYKLFMKVGNVSENDPYNKELLIENYNRHTYMVTEYFKYRPDDLLVLNVGKKGAYTKLCDFLDIKTDKTEFPWENKTENIPV